MPSVVGTVGKPKGSVSTSSKSNSKSVNEDEHQQHLAPFTVKDLKDAIPPHCFDRSLVKSFSYFFLDVIVVCILFSVAYYVSNNYLTNMSWIYSVLFWSAYSFCQGTVMMGLWVVAHECGHQSFSKYKSVNNFVGWVIHSAFLVPYHSWRITHGRHHKNTSHMKRDEVFVPRTRSQIQNEHGMIDESPVMSTYYLFVSLFVGWQLYISTNAWGQDYGKRANHFDPRSPMFKPSQKWDVLVSDLGMILTFVGLAYCSVHFSFLAILKYYVGAYIVLNFWLVVLTYLHHADKRVPHYRGEEWNYIRGALGTVDRDYGILNPVFHHLGDTHVTHHLFSLIPHYHAQEATEALKPILGKYYLKDDTPILKSLWNSWNTLHYVEDDGDVVYYKTIGDKSQ